MDKAPEIQDEPADPALVQARIREIVTRSGGAAKVGRLLGVSRNTVGDWASGRTKMPFSSAIEVAQIASVSLDWLAGLPEPLSQRQEIVVLPDRSSIITPGNGTEGFVPIPRLELQASAGPGLVPSGTEVDQVMMLRTSWLRALGIAPGNAHFLDAKGDSMEKTIYDRDLMLIDRGDIDPSHGFIYVFTVASAVIVKRVQLLFDGSIVLSSDNPRYPSETIAPTRLHELTVEGRVKWFGRAL